MQSKFLPAAAIAAALGLSGCTMIDGYGGVSAGYADGYYDGYGDPYYGASYYGWYDGFYYPGAGYYVYDRGGKRHRWNDHHRKHWEGRRGHHQAHENWSGYRRDGRWSRDGDRSHDGNRGDWNGRRRGDAAPGTAPSAGRWNRDGNSSRGNGGSASRPPQRPDRPQAGQRRQPPPASAQGQPRAAPPPRASAPAPARDQAAARQQSRSSGARGERTRDE